MEHNNIIDLKVKEIVTEEKRVLSYICIFNILTILMISK